MAQYNWFIANVGKEPSAIHCRKSEQADPKILKIFTDIAKTKNIAVRTPMWQGGENESALHYFRQEGIKSTRKVFFSPKGWTGGANEYNLKHDLENLVADINSEEEVVELSLMMGFVDKELFDVSELTWQRGIPLKAIHDGEFCEIMAKNFELISYKDL